MKEVLPEEFYDEYDRFEVELLQKFQDEINRIQKLLQTYQDKTNKEISQLAISKFDKGWIFSGRHPRFSEDIQIPSRTRNHIFDRNFHRTMKIETTS